jgi:DNA replication and repair protein RecF
MFLESLYCKNFRNFRDLNLDLFEGRTLIIGNNGVGKTNLIEMIYFLSTFGSFRTAKLENLLHFDEDFFIVSGTYGDTEVKTNYSGKKEIFVNDLAQKSLREAFGIIPAISLTNDDVEIIDGEPSDRRYLMDISISLHDRKYLNYLYEYRRAKKQRNSLLLKAKRNFPVKNLELWEKQLIKSIYPIVEARNIFTERLSAYTEEIFKELAGEKVTIEYVPGGDYDNIKTQFETRRKEEIEAGYTLFGPHRDDITLKINNRRVKAISSFGTKRLLATSIKMAVSRILTDIREEEPIIIIDEMLDGLDRKNSDSLSGFLKKSKQVLITTTREDFKDKKDYNIYRIEKRNESPFIRKCTEKIHTF